MLRSIKELLGYDIQAYDGEIGSVHDFYFDEKEWNIRYLVVDTGPWILGEKVLLVPDALGTPNWTEEIFPVNLTRQQIQDSPNIKTALPISKQQQIAMHKYYRWPIFWSSAARFSTPVASTTAAKFDNNVKTQKSEKEVIERMMHQSSTLRSAEEIFGYSINGQDAELGQVDDIILDDDSWQIVYLVLDTSSLLIKGKKTLVAIPWINRISYKEREVQLELSQQIIKDSPEYDPGTPINRSFEEVLYDYHGKPYIRTKKNS